MHAPSTCSLYKQRDSKGHYQREKGACWGGSAGPRVAANTTSVGGSTRVGGSRMSTGTEAGRQAEGDRGAEAAGTHVSGMRRTAFPQSWSCKEQKPASGSQIGTEYLPSWPTPILQVRSESSGGCGQAVRSAWASVGLQDRKASGVQYPSASTQGRPTFTCRPTGARYFLWPPSWRPTVQRRILE